MYFKDTNGKTLSLENYKKPAARVPISSKSVGSVENSSKLPTWVIVLIILAILSAVGCGAWWLKKRMNEENKQTFGFHFF